jgi:hypothetical protein
MHFRPRGKHIQVIRTTYDAGTQRGKSTIVGRINRSDLKVDSDLRKACSAEELREVEAWLKSYSKTELLKQEYAVRTLPEQCELAAQWIGGAKGEDAAMAAAELVSAMGKLRQALKRAGFKVVREGREGGKAAKATKATASA